MKLFQLLKIFVDLLCQAQQRLKNIYIVNVKLGFLKCYQARERYEEGFIMVLDRCKF